jgi:regulatory protein YycI of two-component signal transduction system YycFG
MDWAQVLVVILSLFLAIFLLLAIVLTVMLIKVTRQIKTVTESAQRTAEHIEKAVGGVGKIVSPALLLRTISKYFKKAKK